ncbi:MAG: DUF6498-containing protein [Candidatus Paceibacterota bacterium]|jgi:hypothetical protein
MVLITSKEQFDFKKFLSGLFFSKKDTSSFSLIVSNLAPLFGVIFFEWNLFSVIFLYWSENTVIGFYNIFKILMAKESDTGEKMSVLRAGGMEIPMKSKVNTYGHGKITIAVFFIFHYGMFVLIHGVFVLGFFGKLGNPSEGFLYVLFFLLLSHGFSFFENFIGKKEYLKTSPGRQMFQPYARVFVMHFVILVGGIVTMALGAPIFALLILIILKTIVDLLYHIEEHNVYEITDPKAIEEAKKAFQVSK